MLARNTLYNLPIRLDSCYELSESCHMRQQYICQGDTLYYDQSSNVRAFVMADPHHRCITSPRGERLSEVIFCLDKGVDETESDIISVRSLSRDRGQYCRPIEI